MSQLDMFNSNSEIESYYGPRSPQLVYESKPTPKISITEDRLRLRLIGCPSIHIVAVPPRCMADNYCDFEIGRKFQQLYR